MPKLEHYIVVVAPGHIVVVDHRNLERTDLDLVGIVDFTALIIHTIAADHSIGLAIIVDSVVADIGFTGHFHRLNLDQSLVG